MSEEETVETEPTESAAVTEEVSSEEVTEETKATETKEPVEQTEDVAQKKQNNVQHRINELTRQRYEAEERARSEAEARETLERQLQQTQHQHTKPTLDQYGHDTDLYEQAMEQWHAERYQREQEAAQQAQLQQQQQEFEIRRQVAVQQKMADAQAKYPDFAQKINDPSIPQLREISPAAFDAVVDSDQMGEVAYYLANNPQEIYAFQTMTPLQAVKEVAKLEIKLSSQPAKTVTQAPAPPSQVSGRSDAVTDMEKLSTEDWMKSRNKQVNQN